MSPVLAWSAWTLGGLDPLTLVPLPQMTLLQASPLGPWPTLLTLVLVPVTFLVQLRREAATGRLAAVAAGLLIPAAYPWSRLDWTRLLRELGLTHGNAPGLQDVAVAALPLVVVLLVHAARVRRAARRHYEGKGIPDEELAAALGGLHAWSLVALAGGLATAAFLWTGLQLGGSAGGLPDLGALWTPVAAGLLVLAAVLAVLRDRDEAPPAPEPGGGGGGDG